MPFLRTLLSSLFLLLPSAPTTAGDGAAPDFAREVRPILAQRCFVCHGPDPSGREAKLRLDRREEAVADRGGYRAVEPGDREGSELWMRLTSSIEEERMPPPESGSALEPHEVELLGRWIDAGAVYAVHWSFVAPMEGPLPQVTSEAWVRNPIDRFVLARLEEAGRRPAPEADRATLARRLALDLTGLPATPEQRREFEEDTSADAFERYVEQLLASPAYAEHWTAMWLDLARYADSAGHGSDPLRVIWRWRDWVIEAFESNMPFDRFSTLQLAGDLLPQPSLDDRIATAFHRNTMTNTEGGTDDEEFRVAAVKDRAETTMQVWMGLTLGCAECHAHKFDPIGHEEYYGLFAFFNQTEDSDKNDDSPRIQTPSPYAEELEEGEQELSTPIMRELPPEKRRSSHVLLKGNFLNPGEAVEAGVPEALHPMPDGVPQNRLGLARWLFARDNPLTARVTVNRFWARLFGTGLVETEEDFGIQGTQPSHPELLDWLALEFVRSDWDVKHLLRTMVGCATYRQSSRVTSEDLVWDPRNRWLGRGARYRLSAEVIRDQALALSGLLSDKRYGPSVFPPQPDGLWQAAFNEERSWETDTDEDRWRRGLYVFLRRSIPYPSLTTFDAPSREICTPRRLRTNTPLQAFVTLNDPVFVEAARAMARRIVLEGGRGERERAAWALSLCLGRQASEGELSTLVSLQRDALEALAQDEERRSAMLGDPADPLGPPPQKIEAEELAAWTVVANVLLNLDALLTRN